MLVFGRVEEKGGMYLFSCTFETERLWLSGCCDSDVTFIKYFLNEVIAETSGGSCDEEDARHDG